MFPKENQSLRFLVQSIPQLFEVADWLNKCSIIAIDTETSKHRTPAYDDRWLMGISVYSGGTGFYIPTGHLHDESMFGDKNLPTGEVVSALSPVFQRNDKLWVMHNAPFDMNVLQYAKIAPGSNERVGLPKFAGRISDTMIKAHLINENYYSYSLDNLGRVHLGDTKEDWIKKLEKIFGEWELIPPLAMGKYAVQDAKLTYDLERILDPQLAKDTELMQLWLNEDEEYVRILSEVIQAGILIDRTLCEERAHKVRNRMREIERTLGFCPTKPAELAHSLFGLREEGGCSVPVTQGYSKRKSKEFSLGIPNMGEYALSRYRLENPSDQAVQVIDLAIEYRKAQKQASTWYEPFLTLASKDTDLLHPGLKQHGTKTGRLSCEKPNMQQIPRDRKKAPVKDIFRAPSGMELWEFDYSQVELRLAVVYARVASLAETYINQGDVHKLTAELIGAYEALPDDPELARYIGKTTNFLLIYWGGPDKLQWTIFNDTKIVVSLDQCRYWHREFHANYPEFRSKALEVQSAMEHQGFIRLWNGRKRRIKNRDETYNAWNSLIQGGAGQIMKRSMIDLSHRTDFIGQMVNQVHDSLWIYLPVGEVEEQQKLITSVMEWPSIAFGLPFPVDMKRIDQN